MADGRNNRKGCEHPSIHYAVDFARYKKPATTEGEQVGTWLVAEVRFRCSECKHPVTVANVREGVVGDVPVRHPDGLVLLPLVLHEKPEAKPKSPIVLPPGWRG